MSEKVVKLGIAIILLFIFALVLYCGVLEAREWEAYATENNCVEAGYISGSTSMGIAPVIGGNGGVGVVSVYTPSKTRYVCDNGFEIYR